MLVLKPYEVCPHGNRCPNVTIDSFGICQGMNPNRKTTFTCEFVDDDGNIAEGVRNPLDDTGKKKLLVE